MDEEKIPAQSETQGGEMGLMREAERVPRAVNLIVSELEQVERSLENLRPAYRAYRETEQRLYPLRRELERAIRRQAGIIK